LARSFFGKRALSYLAECRINLVFAGVVVPGGERHNQSLNACCLNDQSASWRVGFDSHSRKRASGGSAVARSSGAHHLHQSHRTIPIPHGCRSPLGRDHRCDESQDIDRMLATWRPIGKALETSHLVFETAACSPILWGEAPEQRGDPRPQPALAPPPPLIRAQYVGVATDPLVPSSSSVSRSLWTSSHASPCTTGHGLRCLEHTSNLCLEPHSVPVGHN